MISRRATWWMTVAAVAPSLMGCQQLLKPVEPSPGEKITANQRLAKRIGKEPVAVLQEGLDRYNREVKSYTCTLYQQERLNPTGPMGPVQKMHAKCMEKPFSVYVDAVENPLGASKALFIEGRWGNKMLVLPSGLASLLGCLLIDPHGPQARAVGLRPIDLFGFRRNIEYMIDIYTTADKEGILTSQVLGLGEVQGRPVVIYEVKIREPKPTGRFQFPHVRLSIDCQWLVPIAIDAWDAEGIARGHYRYVDVNLKANLTAKDFVPEANGMTSPPGSAPAATQSAGDEGAATNPE